jgi:hypothetical protein
MLTDRIEQQIVPSSAPSDRTISELAAVQTPVTADAPKAFAN